MAAPALDVHGCYSSVYACRLRVSLLNADGSLDPGAANQYVTDSLISIGSTPEVEAGDELVQKNGCGDICVQVSTDDTVKRFNLAMSLCHLDAELIQLLTGAELLQVGGVTVGLQYPKIGDPKTRVIIEAWSHARSGAQQAAFGGDELYFRHVWPNVVWTIGAYTIESGILTVPLTGKAEENDQMGTGPAGDFPGLITAAQAFFVDDDIPASDCGYGELVVAGSA